MMDPIIGGAIVILSVALPMIIVGKGSTEKGLFGYHCCSWLNSTCLRNGKNVSKFGDRYCNHHFEEYKLKYKVVIGKEWNE